MGYLFAKVRTRKEAEKYKKILQTDEILYQSTNMLVQEKYPYCQTTILEEGSWFYIEQFSKSKYMLDILSKTLSSVDFDSLKKEEFANINYIFSVSEDGNEICFQNIGKKALVQKKRFVIFSDSAKYLPESNSLLIKDCPDAIYVKDKDILLFQKLSSITSIFKGIGELYKEATNQETKAFLKLDFIAPEGIVAEEVNTLNRRRIAQATRILKCMDNDQKKIIHDYISDYCPKLRDKENRFKVTNNEDLSRVLYGIQERYYTTLVGQEKRITNSIITL